MKISEYVAQLTASGLSEDAARGLAKGQAVALTLEDDIGLTKPLASALVKGLVASGLSESDAVDTVRVSIAKGGAVDDLKSEPVTAPDAIAELEAASAALAKGYSEPKDKAAKRMLASADKSDGQMAMPLDKGDDYDDDDDDDDDDDSDLDGDGDPNTMPARKGSRKGADVRKVAAIMKGAVEATSKQLDAQFAALTETINALKSDTAELRAQVNGIAKGVGAQGQAFVALAKGIAQPRPPKSADGLEVVKTAAESVAGPVDYDFRARVANFALAKGQTVTDPKQLQGFNDLLNSAHDHTITDDALRAAAAKLGL